GVAALAYGTETIPAVDGIVGPGNAYVTAAKLLCSSRVRIDLPAGPSEVVVIADASASAERVSADLLAQAEHGADSESVLYTDDAMLSDAVRSMVVDNENVRVELVESLEEAVARSEAYAPEHLELHVADVAAVVGRIRNAGSVFVGGSAAVGDYAAGATHVLPTGGLARSAGGLGPEAFLKPIQIVEVSEDGLRAAAGVVGPLARVEGLPLHAASVEGALAAAAARSAGTGVAGREGT
ncbi:MAG: histidinol dehydrogenase, partial [Actinobacteria bacterium]|nr:histidinol dehydrogenase [Actinomycetota bacterium]